MYNYCLFAIKKDIFNIYENNMSVLYKTLNKLYQCNIHELKYGLSIYNQICDHFNQIVLKNYFSSKNKKYIKNKKNKFLINDTNGETSLLYINSSCLIIKSNSKLPVFLKIINYYNKFIFVTDFNHNEYFWLNDQYK